LIVDNCDAAYARATEAGATSIMPPENTFWGDRYAKVKDPFGHEWSIAHPLSTKDAVV
jgi:PhnB protein